MRIHPAALVFAAVVMWACASDDGGADAELPQGARVQVLTARSPWRSGVIGTVAGGCTAVMIPDSWSAPSRFNAVLVDSITALRISSRFDGRPAPDGTRRVFEVPGDTAGERWRDVPVELARARYGGCASGG